jgi:hypothetical protein
MNIYNVNKKTEEWESCTKKDCPNRLWNTDPLEWEKQEYLGECGKIAFITDFPDDRRAPVDQNHVDGEEEL